MNNDLKSQTLQELEQIVTKSGQKKYIAKYIFSFIHAKHAADIAQITPLSKDFRKELIDAGYHISQLKIAGKLTASDRTVKYLFELNDGNFIEAVLLFENDRRTLCISTQVGCAMNCSFCATAKIKFRRNLTAGEIADQVYTVEKDTQKITNVVYMGMGEPLNNYDEAIKSVKILNDPQGRNLGIRHITLSTCGIAPAIAKLADEKIHPRLALSLNAPTDHIRAKLMPVSRKFPLADLIRAIKNYIAKTKNLPTFEYVMIKNINDTVLHAQMTAKLLKNLKCKVNLIEYNPHGGCNFSPSSKEAIERFAKVLEQAGIKTFIRLKKGQEIKAGCGQLGADWNTKSRRI